MIRKIKAMFIKELKLSLAYKFEFLVWTGILTALFILQYFIWTAIFAHTGAVQIRGFTLQQTILYYGLMLAMSSLTYYDIGNFEWLVRSGQIVVRLIKPFNYLFRCFINFLGSKTIAFIFQVVPLCLFMWFIFKPKLQPIGVVAVLLAMAISFLFWRTVGNSVIWLIKSRGLMMVIEGFVWFASGALLPLAFLPQTAQKALGYLPFQYITYIPIRVLLGQVTGAELAHVLLIQSAWVCVLFVLAIFVWAKAIRALEAVGI